MIKRPLCAAAVLFLGIQTVLAGGFHIAPDWKPTRLESGIGGKEKVVLDGTIYRREEKQNCRVLYLKDNLVHLKNQIFQESKILVYIQTEHHTAIGNQIQITGTAEVFQEARNPGNFDQKFYYRKQGIHVSVWADDVKILDAEEYRIRENLAVLRERWKTLLIECMGEYYGNTMSAMLLGDKSGLDSELKELYQKSGIGHALAISGLHMSFLGIGLYKLLRRAGLPFNIAGGIGICFLLSYTLMIGCGVSSIRAFVMYFVRMGADITGRDYDMPTSLSLAAAVIVAWQPLFLLDAGFLLSFGALLGITAVNPCLESCFLRGKKGRKIFSSFLASLSVNLTLLPVMLYFYFEFPVYSVILNLLVIPLMSLVLGSGVIGSLAAIVSVQAGAVLLQVCKGVLFLYEKACSASMELPVSRIVSGQPEKGWMVIYYILLFLFCLAVYRLKTVKEKGTSRASLPFVISSCKKLMGGAGLLFLCGTLFITCMRTYHTRGTLRITMLDVGQGDGLYIKGPQGMRYFIDGGSSDISDVGKYRIEPFLKSQGAKTLDYVFISHGDADHMSGIEELLENQRLGIRIRNLVLPPDRVQDDALKKLAVKAAKKNTRVVVMDAGDRMTEGNFRLSCKAPTAAYKGETGNAASMVLEAEYGDFDMLFTGDVEGEGEKLLEKGGLRRYDVLKVAHHGSKNSSSRAFLEQTLPVTAWISSGIDNRYGHPHKETIEKLEETGSRIYGTQECGAVTLATDGESAEIEVYLRTFRR